jgi:lysozyme
MTDDTQPTQSKARLIALVGTLCCSITLTAVPKFEGTILTTYKDPIGIATVCTGETMTAALGRAYTPEQCETMLEDRLATEARDVLDCVPELKGKTYPLASALSLSYNIGVRAFCNSTAARYFREGNILAACDQYSRFIYAGGKILPGLVKRRAIERQMCLTTGEAA